MQINACGMTNKGTESASSLVDNTDVSQVRQLVQQWRQAYSQLRFEHQRQRDEIVHLGMHERLSEDNEKLLRRENASLKQALAEHADAAAKLKKLRAENETLREDLDDARASVCAGQLEHEARQSELRRQLDAEIRDRREAQLKLDAETTACAKLRDELEARGDENALLAAELKECRELLKTKEQEYRCQVIATKLERDEQVARLEGRLQHLQTSAHDACRQQLVTLQQELERARTELAQHLANRRDDPPPASEQPGASSSQASQRTTSQRTIKASAAESSQSLAAQERPGTSTKQRTWPEAFGGLWCEEANKDVASVQGDRKGVAARNRGGGLRTVETSRSCSSGRRETNATGVLACSQFGPEKDSSRGDSRGPVSDGTVDSTHRAQSSRDLVAKGRESPAVATAPATLERPNAPRTPLKVSDIIKKSTGRRSNRALVTAAFKDDAPPPACGLNAAAYDGIHTGDVVVSDSDPGEEDGDQGPDGGGLEGIMVAATPPTSPKQQEGRKEYEQPKQQQQKKRRLCLEVDDMLFVDA
ncbi:uncharacterized protein LOC119406479 [Rhipicephalus sanguineus]|uniref:uncharacterized protein LOC119406479 n=1 Tax=Rhipicephalus sanguineus TaxID=34632 RepID=UPI0020C5A62A|nr:uncharacterized protein LOC119406479 [Rhipicephalus sanguineus]